MLRASLLLLAAGLACCDATSAADPSATVPVELFVRAQVPDFYELPGESPLRLKVANLCANPKVRLAGRDVGVAEHLGSAFEILPASIEWALKAGEIDDCVFVRESKLEIDCTGQAPPIAQTTYSDPRTETSIRWGRQKQVTTTFRPGGPEVSGWTAFTVVVGAGYDDLPRTLPFGIDGIEFTQSKYPIDKFSTAYQLYPPLPLPHGSTQTIRLVAGGDDMRTTDGHCLDVEGERTLTFHVRDEDPPVFRLEAHRDGNRIVVDGEDLGARLYQLEEGTASVEGVPFDFVGRESGTSPRFLVPTGEKSNAVRCFRLRLTDALDLDLTSQAACVDETR